jgi:tetratricopeptide (TPR) repeat protein
MFTALEAFQIATQYYRAGQLAPAQQMFRYVLELEPEHAEALHFLGGISLESGEFDQAIVYYQKALQSSPASAEYWNDLGAVCIVACRFSEGADAIEQALLLRPDYPEAYNNLGIAWQQLGQPGRALDCFEQAVRLRPSFGEAYSNLGNSLREQGQIEAAVATCEQAFRLNPESPQAAHNLGLALHEMGQVDQAVDYYRQALQLRPNFAEASNNLATALKEQGLFDEAVSQYRKTLQLQPNHALVFYNLSQLVADGRAVFTLEELARLRGLVANYVGSAVERSTLAFALAAVLERQGAYDEAFQFYHRANEGRRQCLLEGNSAFDRMRYRAQVDRVIATFDEAYFRTVQNWGTNTDLPIFVLGMPRSGTTLVEQILASHPEVFGAGELGELPRIMLGLAQEPGRDDRYDPPLPLPTEAVAHDLAAGFLRRIEQLGGPARRVTIKTLENYISLGIIGTMFPGAPVIYCRRDPLDVCVSCYFQNFKGMDFSWSLEDIGVYYRQYERLMAHWQRIGPMRVLEVHYEELIARPEEITRKMLGFCGLGWYERCLAFYKNPRVVRTASTVQVRKPLTAKSIGRWKHYAEHLAPLFQALGLGPGGEILNPQRPQKETGCRIE